MNKLVEQAKKGNKTTLQKRSKDEVELALAWLRSEVNPTQIGHVLDMMAGGSAVYSWLAITLREAYRNGQLEIWEDEQNNQIPNKPLTNRKKLD